MFDIRILLKEGAFGDAYIGMDLTEFRMKMPTPDFEQVHNNAVFIYYGDMELCFVEVTDCPIRRLFYIQPKFMQIDGRAEGSVQFPFDMALLREKMSLQSFKLFCTENEISLEREPSTDDDCDQFLVGGCASCYFPKRSEECEVYYGLKKILVLNSHKNCRDHY